ncbi:MAG TPA: OmpA family protein [Kofleriaceae bacterium]|jgi:outer membrane protein OmpA-like peptidoglycan-associated protein|nr:OmpA family protein [Kofleriaceae bacterium]
MRLGTSLVIIAMLGAPVAASPWISAEVPAAMPLSDPHAELWNAGAMPSIAGLVDLGEHIAVGARVRAGALGNGSAPAGGLDDPQRGGLLAFEAAVRFTAGSGWLELDGGGGITGRDGVPTVELGGGVDFLSIGSIELGPSVRYVRVIGGGTPMDPGTAALVLVGFEARIGATTHARRAEPEVFVEQAPDRDDDRVSEMLSACPLDQDGRLIAGCARPPADRDGDGVPDAIDQCPDQAEVVNGVDDQDGCPDQGGLFEVKDDRIVLDEQVLFDLNRARIKHSGREVIAAIAKAWREHPEWMRMSVEGHCDVRGPATFNQWLSEQRADRVLDELVKEGVPADHVSAVGYGATRPRDPGTTEDAHQHNRRVEFVIERQSANAGASL